MINPRPSVSWRNRLRPDRACLEIAGRHRRRVRRRGDDGLRRQCPWVPAKRREDWAPARSEATWTTTATAPCATRSARACRNCWRAVMPHVARAAGRSPRHDAAARRPSWARGSWASACRWQRRASRCSPMPPRPAAGLYVLIAVLGPISGAHFNPAVTLAMRLRGELDNEDAARLPARAGRRRDRRRAARARDVRAAAAAARHARAQRRRRNGSAKASRPSGCC